MIKILKLTSENVKKLGADGNVSVIIEDGHVAQRQEEKQQSDLIEDRV